VLDLHPGLALETANASGGVRVARGRLAYSGGVSSREELPRFVAPMLARTGPVPVGDTWALEVKFDGMRLLLRRDGCAVCLRSRPGRDCTEEFPELWKR